MTKIQWLAASNASEMLDPFLNGRVSMRKLRLFACEWCRRVYRATPRTDVDVLEAIFLAEQIADGLIDDEPLAEHMRNLLPRYRRHASDAALAFALIYLFIPEPVMMALRFKEPGWGEGSSGFLRDIVGIPFPKGDPPEGHGDRP